MARSNQPIEDESDPAVEPIESVDKIPNKSKELCWNCKNHDKKNHLDIDGLCEVCGFDKNTLYNGTIEADKIAQRVEAAQAAANSQR